MTSNDDYVLQLLQEQGYVSSEQIETVISSIRQEGETTLDILIQTGAVTEDDVLAMIAAQFGMEYVHVNADAIDPSVKGVISTEVARKYGVVPVSRTEDSVTVALSDPMGYDTVDSLHYVLKMNVDAVVAPRAEVKAAIDKLYPEEFESVYGSMSDSDIDVAEKAKGDAGSEADVDAPVIRLVSMIITEACKMHASDIHMEPMERHFRVRYRIDGVLRQMESPRPVPPYSLVVDPSAWRKASKIDSSLSSGIPIPVSRIWACRVILSSVSSSTMSANSSSPVLVNLAELPMRLTKT